ncbi:Kelch motif containing protein [Novymonas esmeraldas]|uniref:Kelch motif containing protein n=1 Tax=Novymonas esmeraldas TaxID=1808958 RepID=A0AAW0EXX3_9TRYP
MLSTEYGFGTSVRRSGHAACWCSELGGLVQFGGWPPSEQLGEVVRHDGSSCPLFLLPATTIARHVHRADQRRAVDVFSAALAPHRQRRLRRLCDLATRAAPGDHGGDPRLQRRRGPPTSSTASSAASALSATTEEASERGFEYDEGYVSEQESDDAGSQSPPSSTPSSANSRSRSRAATAATDAVRATSPPSVVAPTITVELLRQVALETGDRVASGGFSRTSSTPAAALPDHTSVSPSSRTGYAASALRDLTRRHSGGPATDKEAPPVRADTREVRGKHTVRPLRWQRVQPAVAPRTRHGHHLVCCGHRLYVIGGSYWAHGNALASTDMMYDVRERTWHQLSSLFPQRFCAALARSNAVPSSPASTSATDALYTTTTTIATITSTGTADAPRDARTTTAPTTTVAMASARAGDGGEEQQQQQVLYYFGGLDYSHELTNTLHRLWLPHEVLEELPQYGAVPRRQFKGVLVCDVQRECTPAERRAGERAVGRLFYMDGLQDGRPMAPYLRLYNLSTGVWVRVCPSPDLVRSQVSLLQYEPVAAGQAATRLRRFEVLGGMPARRGRQRRSRMCVSFDVGQQCFDYSHALPVPGLTAHCVVLLPPLDTGAVEVASGAVSGYAAALDTLRRRCGTWSLCCGGNEDWTDAEQNSLGDPVGWLYLLAPRPVRLSEAVRVLMDRLRMPSKVLTVEKDDLLHELF